MIKSMKKTMIIYLIASIVACSYMVIFYNVSAYEFAGNEEYWSGYCQGVISSDDKQKQIDCNAYSEYISGQLASAQGNASSLSASVDAVKADLSNLEEVSRQYLAEIETVQNEIIAINASLIEMENSIVELEAQIGVTLSNIEQRSEQIAQRMIQLQVSVNTNQYFDFIMGATDLVDLVQKSSHLSQFTENDQQQIELLEAEQLELEFQREEAERLQEGLELQSQNAALKEEQLVQYKAENDALVAEYEIKVMELQNALNEAQGAANTLANLKPSFSISAGGDANIGDVNSNGFLEPIQGSWISRGVYYGHRGIDYAASIGTPIIAPADSYIVFACTGFGAGWFGNTDGPSKGAPVGGGNSVRIMFVVNGQTFAMNFHHLSSVPANILSAVGTDTVIPQGQVIGYVGSSGNSTGPHAHVEMFTLNQSIQQAVATWFSTGDWQSSAGWGNATPAYGSYGSRIDPAIYL